MSSSFKHTHGSPEIILFCRDYGSLPIDFRVLRGSFFSSHNQAKVGVARRRRVGAQLRAVLFIFFCGRKNSTDNAAKIVTALKIADGVETAIGGCGGEAELCCFFFAVCRFKSSSAVYYRVSKLSSVCVFFSFGNLHDCFVLFCATDQIQHNRYYYPK